MFITITRRPPTPLLPPTGQPDAGRRTAVSAYSTVLSLYVLAGGAHALTGLLVLVELSGGTAPDAVRTAAAVGRLIGLAGAALWLMFLLLARSRRSRTRPWRVLAVLAGSTLVVIADESGFLSSGDGSTQVVGPLVEMLLWVWLCTEITARQGITLWRPLPRPFRPLGGLTEEARARSIGWARTYYAYLPALGGGALLAMVLTSLPGPVMKGDQGAAAGVPDLGPGLAHGVWSATIEELLATAVVVAVLTAARRPLWETLAVVAVMRTLPHAYLGLWPMFAAVVPAVAAGWLYHRYQRVVPLVLAHVLFNTVGAFHGSVWRYVFLVPLVLLGWFCFVIAKQGETPPAETAPGQPEPVPAGRDTDRTTAP